MKKLFVILAVLMWTVPAFGSVDFSITDDAGVVTISYLVSSGDNPSGIALRLNVDAVQGSADVDTSGTSGATVNSTGDVSGLSTAFQIYLDAAWDEETNGDGYTLNEGGPLAKWIVTPGVDKGLALLPASKVAICMGHLRTLVTDPYAGPASDDLLSIALTGLGTTYVVLDVDDDRGGVTGSELATNLPIELEVTLAAAECFPSDAAYATQYATWVALGKPDCWCAPPEGSGHQCHGDADGAEEGAFVKYRVYNADLSLVLVDNWQAKTADWDPADPLGALPGNLNPCADIDHKEEGAFVKYRVYNADLARLLNMNWADKTADLPGDCPLTDAANDTYVDPTP